MIDKFVPQMRGNSQQDSQEFLAFLMDGLHEDLNKVKKRQYALDVDNGKLSDGEAAKQAWLNHRKQNDSIIVDFFQVFMIYNHRIIQGFLLTALAHFVSLCSPYFYSWLMLVVINYDNQPSICDLQLLSKFTHALTCTCAPSACLIRTKHVTVLCQKVLTAEWSSLI